MNQLSTGELPPHPKLKLEYLTNPDIAYDAGIKFQPLQSLALYPELKKPSHEGIWTTLS